MNTKEAFDTVKAAMRADDGYAWTWHCNIAMAFIDGGGGTVDHATANEAAAVFMERCFNIDVRKSAQWQSLFRAGS